MKIYDVRIKNIHDSVSVLLILFKYVYALREEKKNCDYEIYRAHRPEKSMNNFSMLLYGMNVGLKER